MIRVFLTLVLLSQVSFAKALPIPEIKFNYGALLDVQCNKDLLSSEEIEKNITDVIEFLPQLSKAWSEDGLELLKTLVKITGHTFKEQKYEVSLMTCLNITSMSSPLLINIRRFVPNFNEGETYPPFAFVTTAFHELIHRFIDENARFDGPILSKYAALPPKVRNHIPLFVLEKAVFQRLVMVERLKRLEHRERKTGPLYSQAWDIADELSTEDVIEEMFPVKK